MAHDDEPEPHPDDAPIVVTFDDGTADLAEVATPILVRHGVPATVYLATRYVDEGIDFPDDGTPLSWAAVRDMASTGAGHVRVAHPRPPAARPPAARPRPSTSSTGRRT